MRAVARTRPRDGQWLREKSAAACEACSIAIAWPTLHPWTGLVGWPNTNTVLRVVELDEFLQVCREVAAYAAHVRWRCSEPRPSSSRSGRTRPNRNGFGSSASGIVSGDLVRIERSDPTCDARFIVVPVTSLEHHDGFHGHAFGDSLPIKRCKAHARLAHTLGAELLSHGVQITCAAHLSVVPPTSQALGAVLANMLSIPINQIKGV